MRVDKSIGDIIHTEDTYYIIEEHQSEYDRWVHIRHHYLPEYEFGEFSACGRCWQETGKHGCFDLEYAKEYCNKLNQALEEGTIKVDNPFFQMAKISRFRICECERTFKKTPLVANRY